MSSIFVPLLKFCHKKDKGEEAAAELIWFTKVNMGGIDRRKGNPEIEGIQIPSAFPAEEPNLIISH